MQVSLRRRDLDAFARQRDRRLDQPPPGKGSVAPVRRLEARDLAGHRARARADEKDLRRGAVEVDVDRLHVRLDGPPRALTRHPDEEVEQAVGAVPRAVDEQEPAGTGPGQRALRDRP